MEELYFDKLGNFTEKDCKNIKKMMDGSTFYNYSVGWSNWASNCNLVVKADCGDEDKERAKKNVPLCGHRQRSLNIQPGRFPRPLWKCSHKGR